MEKYELIIEIIVSGDETVKQKIQKFFLENKYRSLLMICLVGLSLIFLSRLIFTSEKAIKKEVLKPLVHTEVMYRRPMYKTISLFGKTVSDAQVDIINKYAGKIEEINVIPVENILEVFHYVFNKRLDFYSAGTTRILSMQMYGVQSVPEIPP